MKQFGNVLLHVFKDFFAQIPKRLSYTVNKNIFLNMLIQYLPCLLLSSLGFQVFLIAPYSTGASYRSFYPIINKTFYHLETLLTICRPKKVLSAGSLCGPLVPIPEFECPKRTLMLPQKYHIQFPICYQSYWNISWKRKTNKFQGPNMGQTPCKVLGQGLYFTP